MWHLRSPGDEKMTDITTIPEAELRKDLQDSHDDIARCKIQLFLGITSYNGNSYQERLDTNQRIIEKIEAELARREKETK
jgi:hypothetical protein